MSLPCAIAFWLALLFGGPASASETLPSELAGIVAQAADQGLPDGALQAKAREGLAKGVPVARIAAVLRGMVDGLAGVDITLAQLDVGPDRAELLVAGLAAHNAGMSDAGLRALAQQPQGLRARATQAAADLLRIGFSEPDAVSLVSLAVRAEDPLDELSGLATAASVLVSSGLSPSVAASRLSSDAGTSKHPLANVPPQSRSDLPEPAQDAPGHGPKGPK